MNHEMQIRHRLTTLPAKQQALDFGDVATWQHLPENDRRACCLAIATLLCQVTKTKLSNEQLTNKENTEYER
jgi:hypothetical protein